MKRIAIIGTRGIPAKYGGFETLAEHLSLNLDKKISLSVYCPKSDKKNYNGKFNNTKLIYINAKANGLQSIFYDIFSIIDATFFKKHSVLLILGTSGSIVIPIIKLFSKVKIIINIDGLEHKREKWNPFAKRMLKWFEKIAIKYSDEIITDNMIIKEYVKVIYNKDSHFIAYGGDHAFKLPLQDSIKQRFHLPHKYAFKVCRIEPENNIELILNAFCSFNGYPLIIIGNWNSSKYSRMLKSKYSTHKNLIILDAIYDYQILNQIRSNCYIYIHGHSAGGTNPSLVEAMSLGLPIIAFDVSYNRATTMNEARYFRNNNELKDLLNNVSCTQYSTIGAKMLSIAKEKYTWEKISKQYYKVLTLNK